MLEEIKMKQGKEAGTKKGKKNLKQLKKEL